MAIYAQLKDGTSITIRPMLENDYSKSLNFFQKLPEADRAYLRVNVLDPEFVENRILKMMQGKVKRIVAENENEIVADGALELEDLDWERHVGELRLIIAPEYRRKGLGMHMAKELYFLAIAEKVEEVIVKMMKPQIAAINIFKRLGFRESAVLPNYVKDIKGEKHDLIVMRCDIVQMWQELEDYLAVSDWQRER